MTTWKILNFLLGVFDCQTTVGMQNCISTKKRLLSKYTVLEQCTNILLYFELKKEINI